MLIVVLALCALLLLAGFFYQQAGVRRDRQQQPPPGKLFRVQGAELHLHALGSGPVTVILESGIAASSVNWTMIQLQASAFAKVCRYDRAGFGWSLRIRKPRMPRQLAAELHELLEAAEVKPPYLLVGHSFGGLIVRAFAAAHPDEVAGILLVDALHPADWVEATPAKRRRLAGGVFFSRVGALLATFGVVRLCLQMLARGRSGAPRAVLRSFGSEANKTVSRIVGEVAKLPADVLPQIQAHWSRATPFLTMADYLAKLPESCAEAATLPALPQVPLTVLSAETAHSPERLLLQKELAQLCTGAEHTLVPECGHWIQLDRPDLVVEVIRRLVERIEQRARA